MPAFRWRSSAGAMGFSAEPFCLTPLTANASSACVPSSTRLRLRTLGEGASAAPALRVAESGGVVVGVWDGVGGAVQPHQAQARVEGPRGEGVGQGACDALEEQPQRRDAQALAGA